MKMTQAAKDWYFNTKFPYTDKDGWVWIDPTGYDNVISVKPVDDFGPGPCFICQKETPRVDINFMTFFCNSENCNKQIKDELSKTTEPGWNGGVVNAS